MRFDVSGAHVHTRSRLLGIIAGLFTVVAAQAAELPVKAKPVQYVKVCTLYGAGFYYIPGTQTCMKIGGFVRAEIKYHAIGSFEPAINGANAQFFRAGDQVDTRARAGISVDSASRPSTERFAPISSPVGNTPAMTPRHSAFQGPRFQPP